MSRLTLPLFLLLAGPALLHAQRGCPWDVRPEESFPGVDGKHFPSHQDPEPIPSRQLQNAKKTGEENIHENL